MNANTDESKEASTPDDDYLAGESQEYREWVEAGEPEPTAAERVDGGDCSYEDCENDAEYRVEWERQTTVLMCDNCSRTNRIWVVENDLLAVDIVADEDGGADE